MNKTDLLSDKSPVKHRIKAWLESLRSYANNPGTYGGLDPAVNCEFVENKDYVKVWTTQKDLIKLFFSETGSKKLKDKLRYDLSVLEKYDIITSFSEQGKEKLFFQINLPCSDRRQFLEAFEQKWHQGKNKTERTPHQALAKTTSKVEVASTTNFTQHNLPTRQHTTLIGRKDEITKLIELLSPYHSNTNIIAIEGLGGVGKTALALEVAHRCLQASQKSDLFPEIPTFEAIIFCSAQSESFIGSKFSQKLRSERSLPDIFHAINQTLKHFDRLPPTLVDRVSAIVDSLSRQSCLLILDNLETLQEQDHLLGFLQEIPPNVKLILTSRVKTGLGTIINLNCLDRQSGLELIAHQAQQKSVCLSDRELERIYPQTAGLPLSIVYTIGQIAVGGIVPENAAIEFDTSNQDLAYYCFEESFRQFRGRSAEKLLIALSLLPQPASLASLAYIALDKTETATAKQGLTQLFKRSLLERQEDKYTIHPLTRQYVRFDCQKITSNILEIQDRQVQWYLELTQPCLNLDWQDWQDYSFLDADWLNLRYTVEWCREQDRYLDFQNFWQRLKGYTLFSGHWLERLDWLEWLIETARQRQDLETLAEGLYHKSRTLAHLNEADPTGEAMALGEAAWQISNSDNWHFQFDIAIYLATLLARKQQFKLAQNWLEKSQFTLQSHSGNVDYVRRWIQTCYCQAEIYWRTQNYQAAKDLYLIALARAQEINWQSMSYYIQAWMAAIAVETKDWQRAEELLKLVLEAATQHSDYRSLAYCQRYFAILEQKRQRQESARHWADSAQKAFERLHMTKEAAEMRSLADIYR